MKVDASGLLRASRSLPQPIPDTQEIEARSTRYGDQYVVSLVQTTHVVSDEGGYFYTSNPTPGTGIIINMVASYAATTPMLVIQNSDVLGGKRIYLDWIKIITTVLGGGTPASTWLQYAAYIDSINRYTSGGSALAVVNPNMDASQTPVGKAWFGAISAPAASSSQRLVSSGQMRTIAAVLYDTYLFTFGGIEKNVVGNSLALATAGIFEFPLPPVILGPGTNQSFLLNTWQGGETTTGRTYTIECGWWER